MLSGSPTTAGMGRFAGFANDSGRRGIMLVLSRKLGQTFQLGSDVRITVIKIDRQSVRIGIQAPGDLPVYREEIVPVELSEPASSGRAEAA
jgi:carbon storage regulator